MDLLQQKQPQQQQNIAPNMEYVNKMYYSRETVRFSKLLLIEYF